MSSVVFLFFDFFVKKSSRFLREENGIGFQFAEEPYFFSIEALRTFFIHIAAATESIGAVI